MSGGHTFKSDYIAVLITAHAVTNFIAYLSEPCSSRATIESKVITV